MVEMFKSGFIGEKQGHDGHHHDAKAKPVTAWAKGTAHGSQAKRAFA